MELSEEADPKIPLILPHDKVFSIQVGYKLFKISGASLSSDGPSYFTNFFSAPDNESKVLFIDRNPLVFDKLYMHLQGYHIKIESEYEFVYIWQDAFYYGLKRLQRLLNDECSIACIGNQTFRVPKSLVFSTGNYPNYFSVGLESLMTKGNLVEHSLSMIRPPSQKPPSTANRSPKLFADLLEVFWGNERVITDDKHRDLLVKECQYYHFLELEQRLVKHRVTRNPFSKKAEITLNLSNVVPQGIINPCNPEVESPVAYVRPFIAREQQRDLIIEIDSGADSTIKLILNRLSGVPVVVLENKHATKVMQLFKDLKANFGDPANKKKLVVPCSLEICATTINGCRMKPGWYSNFLTPPPENQDEPEKKRPRSNSASGDYAEFQIVKSLWRVLKHGDKSLFQAVLINAVSDPLEYNQSMVFL